MEHRTIIGVFEPSTDINTLVRDLLDHGFSKTDLLILNGADSPGDRSEAGDRYELTTLFLDRGVPDPEAGYLAESVRQGDRVVSVQAGSFESAGEAEAILNRHGALEIEERAREPRISGPSAAIKETSSALSGDALDRSLKGEYQTGRTRGSRVFVW